MIVLISLTSFFFFFYTWTVCLCCNSVFSWSPSDHHPMTSLDIRWVLFLHLCMFCWAGSLMGSEPTRTSYGWREVVGQPGAGRWSNSQDPEDLARSINQKSSSQQSVKNIAMSMGRCRENLQYHERVLRSKSAFSLWEPLQRDSMFPIQSGPEWNLGRSKRSRAARILLPGVETETA